MSYSSEVLADAPLAYWRLGEASGATVAADASGNGHPGTYSDSPTLGVTGLLVGDPDTCMELDGAGTAQGVLATNAAWMQPTALTVEAIIRPDDTSGSRTIASRRASGLSGSSSQSWSFLQTDGSIQLRVYVNGSSTTGFVGSTGGIVAGTTYHVAATFDNTTMRLYIDGAEVANSARSGTLNAGSRDLAIGFDPVGTTTFRYDGKLDEFAIYGSALSGTRIAAHHTAAITNPTISGALAATFPPFDVDLAGRSAQPFDVEFPSFRDTFSGGVTQAGEIDAAFPVFETDFAGVLPDVAAGDALVTFPSFRSNIAGQLDEAISTDVSNDWNARVRDGRGLVETEVAVEPLPANLTRAVRVDKAVPYPTPDLVNGRPT